MAAAAMSGYIAGNGVIMSRPQHVAPRVAPARRETALAFPDVHEFRPAWLSSGMCGHCFCAIDDWRHMTPLRHEDRLFT